MGRELTTEEQARCEELQAEIYAILRAPGGCGKEGHDKVQPLRAEMDAILAVQYGYNRDLVDHIVTEGWHQ